MYSFDELHPGKKYLNGKSVAYWVAALRGSLPATHASARALSDAMSFHYDIEEQAWDEEHIRSTPELLFDVVSPIAPVSLAEAWSPLPLACQLLGPPKLHGIDKQYDWSRSAYGVFESTCLAEDAYSPTMEHDRHGFRLLRFGCARALELEADILVVASPGWSYQSCKEEAGMSPEVVEIMKRVGYFYTDRVSR